MGFWKSLSGLVRVRITSADIPATLQYIAEKGISLQDIVYENDLTVFATVSQKHYKKLAICVTNRGDKCEFSEKWGIYWTLYQIYNRPIMIAFTLFLIFISVYVPSRIYFFEVRGNQNTPDRVILEKAQEIGLTFGCHRGTLRSDDMKNALLEALPQLEWVGITTEGCVGIINVTESIDFLQQMDEKYSVSSLVASCDGVIESVTATSGTPLCRPGQAVRKGQVLISGYQDHGLVVNATNAVGEVYARTYRYLELVTPAKSAFRTELIDVETKYSVQIGKKLINFFKDSGISPIGCVKMYSASYVKLPGGFQIPVALMKETAFLYDVEQDEISDRSYEWTETCADKYIRNQMLAGEVLHRKLISEYNDDLYVLSVEYACREQIGAKRNEESLLNDGENS